MQVVSVCHPPPALYQAPSFNVPAQACDAHLHVTPRDHRAISGLASYQPAPAPPSELRRMHAALGIARAVVVQASAYGQDNTGVEEALRGAPDRWRGVVVAGRDVAEQQLDYWHGLGVRGMRFIMSGQLGGTVDFDDLECLAPRLAERGWHAEILPRSDQWLELLPRLQRLPCALVIDHLGGMPASQHDEAAERAILSLLKQGNAWVKLIGYRLSEDLHDPQLIRRAHTFHRAAPGRMVWGSDWPHVGLDRAWDAGVLLNALATWFDRDEEVLRRILCDNPQQVFGFPTEPP